MNGFIYFVVFIWLAFSLLALADVLMRFSGPIPYDTLDRLAKLGEEDYKEMKISHEKKMPFWMHLLIPST